jgi:Flp pilus assembly protein TadG
VLGLSRVSRKIRFSFRCRKNGAFSRDASGATAVEFGLVALPFLMMLAGIIDVGTYYFALNTLDRGIDETARFIRTGEAQTGGFSYSAATQTANPGLDATTIQGFKVKVCEQAKAAGGNFDCSKFTVVLNFGATWADVAAANQTCTQGTAPNVTLNAGTTSTDQLTAHVGGTSSVVIATVCYPWDVAKFLPFLKVGNLQDGSMLLQSSTAFQTEPY